MLENLNSPALLLDDDVEFCAEIETFLSKYHVPVITAHTPSDAERILREQEIGLLLLDVMLPEKHGFQFCREARDRMERLPILFVSAYCDTMEQVLGFEAGADDFLRKPFMPQELLARMKAVLRRAKPSAEPAPPVQPEIIRSRNGLWIDTTRCHVWLDEERVRLTPFQYEVLLYFMRHPQRLITRSEVMRNVHLYGAEILSRSVDINVSRIRKALGDSVEDPRFIRTVWRQGYLFVDDVV